MMTDASKFLLTLIGTVAGSGLGTTIVAALFRRRLDANLETHKALLQRGGQVHTLQVEALLSIHCKIDQALFFLQRVTSAGRFQGEDEKVLLQRMAQALGAASEEFSRNRLLFAPPLERALDEFFQKMIFAGIELNLALDPTVLGGPKVNSWDSARKAAYSELPTVLEAIRVEGRRTIHG
jgi:hypothetical protein